MKDRLNKRRFPQPNLSSVSRERLTKLFSEWRRTIGYYSIFAAVGALATGSPKELPAQDLMANAQTLPQESGTLARRRAVRPESLRSRNQSLLFTTGALSSARTMTASDDCPGTPIPAGAYTAASPYIDTGDTTGANNTVTTVSPYYSYNSYGPDRIYSFVTSLKFMKLTRVYSGTALGG
ncbi:MAG: hypothetical protein ABJB34_01045 [Acidobacteriota bacterium]